MSQDCPQCGNPMMWKYLNTPRCGVCDPIKKRYTVVLQRPEYMDEATPYVATVEATTPKDAAQKAQEEAFAADTEDELAPETHLDYYVSVVFNGQCNIELFGWQL